LFTSPLPEPTLLVVEDASDHAALIRVAARRAFPGLDVRVAGDGREGIAYLEGTPPFQDRRSHPFPDLVILDLIMPNVDGFGVLEHVRGRRWREPFPVVVLTASPDQHARERSLALGADAFYLKPDGLEALGRVVGEIVTQWLRNHVASGTISTGR
jgi:two-component system, response regulator